MTVILCAVIVMLLASLGFAGWVLYVIVTTPPNPWR